MQVAHVWFVETDVLVLRVVASTPDEAGGIARKYLLHHHGSRPATAPSPVVGLPVGNIGAVRVLSIRRDQAVVVK